MGSGRRKHQLPVLCTVHDHTGATLDSELNNAHKKQALSVRAFQQSVDKTLSSLELTVLQVETVSLQIDSETGGTVHRVMVVAIILTTDSDRKSRTRSASD